MTYDANSRSISETFAIGDNLILEITTCHYKNKKAYVTTARRATVGNGFVEYMPIGDVVILRNVPVARFSAKALKAQQESMLDELNATGGLTKLRMWASQKLAD